MSTSSTKTVPIYVSKAKSNDVVLGRGTKLSEREGNTLFRDIAREYALTYVKAATRAAKNKIAKQVLVAFAQQSGNGRFLRRISAHDSKGSVFVEVYEQITSKDELVAKTKQRLRDFANRSPDLGVPQVSMDPGNMVPSTTFKTSWPRDASELSRDELLRGIGQGLLLLASFDQPKPTVAGPLASEFKVLRSAPFTSRITVPPPKFSEVCRYFGR